MSAHDRDGSPLSATMTDLSSKCIVVTGATGFIGSHLTRALVHRGHKVHVITRPGSSLWRITDLLNHFVLHEADICDNEKLIDIFQRANPSHVFHLAGLVDPSRRLDLVRPMVETNLFGRLNVLLAAQAVGVSRVVNTGTCEEYGTNLAPFVEAFREQPVSPYSASNVAATHFGQMLYRMCGLPVVTVRPFLTYGPAQGGSLLIPSLIKAALRGECFEMTLGEQTREFLYVQDIVDGFIAAASAPNVDGETINLCSGVEHRVADVARLVVDLLEIPIALKVGALPYRAGEVMHFYGRPEKAFRLLKWRPSVDLHEGLMQTIVWYKSHWRNNERER